MEERAGEPGVREAFPTFIDGVRFAEEPPGLGVGLGHHSYLVFF